MMVKVLSILIQLRLKGCISSDRVQTVRDIRLRIPDIPGAKVDFTLIGTRDANENPVPVNVPMKVILPDEIVSDSDTDPTTTLNSDSSVVPTAEELRAGKKTGNCQYGCK